jgi:putative acetyltransferase
MYNIRIGDANDIPSLINIWRRSVVESHGFLTSADIDALEPEARAGLAALELWVAEDAGQAAGFMAMNGDMIEVLFIDPDHRGKSWGAASLSTPKQSGARAPSCGLT